MYTAFPGWLTLILMKEKAAKGQPSSLDVRGIYGEEKSFFKPSFSSSVINVSKKISFVTDGRTNQPEFYS
jgi:hypothetical protein